MFIFKDYITGVVFIKYKVSLFLKKITLCLYVKTTKNLIPRDLRGLRAFAEESIVKKHIIVCREERKRLIDDKFMVYPWKEFLSELWNGDII